MPHLFSPSTLTFYHTEVPYPDLPEDVNEVTDELHEGIMESLLLHGKVLQADAEGAPQAVEAINEVEVGITTAGAGDAPEGGAKGGAG